MRYVSKAEKERQRWMTLVEAINSITSKECDQREAVNDLFRAIADNNVKARRAIGHLTPTPLMILPRLRRMTFKGK